MEYKARHRTLSAVLDNLDDMELASHIQPSELNCLYKIAETIPEDYKNDSQNDIASKDEDEDEDEIEELIDENVNNYAYNIQNMHRIIYNGIIRILIALRLE